MTATLSEGHYARRFGFAFSLCSRGNVPSTPTAFLRFRTNDVLLGTSGVGVCVSVVSNSPGIYYFFIFYFLCYIGCPPAFPIIYSAYLGPTAARRPSGCRIESAAMTLINFFTSSGPNFARGVSYDSIQRSQAVAWCVVRFRHGRHKVDKGRRVMTIECNRAYFTPVRAHARALPRLCSPSCLCCCRRGCS